MPTNKRNRSILGQLAKPAVAITATLLALVVCEVVVRSLGRGPDVKAIQLGTETCVYKRSTNPLLGFELKANYRNDDPDLIQSYARTNSHGQRDKERTLEKPPGVRRILLLGDSVVEGYGLRERDTISRQLEDLYEDGRTEVLNFGVSAYCTRAEVELLEVKGLRFDPDVVILVFVENDFDNFNREAFPLGGTISRPAVVQFLFVRSHLFRLSCVRWNLFHYGAEADPVRWNKSAIGDNNVAEGLPRFAELARAHRFQPLVAIWPRFFDSQIADVPFMPENTEELVVERLAAMHGIPTVRLSAYFRRHRMAREDDVNPRLRYTSGDQLHPSAEGSRVAAMALRQELTKLDGGGVPVPSKMPSWAGGDETAIAAAKALGTTKPNYARVYHRTGTDLLKAGKLTEAVEQFEMALAEDPKHAGAHNNLGIAYERMGRADAQAQFEQAILLEPDFVHAHFNLARTLLAKGSAAKAIAGFQRTLELDPDHVGALTKLGVELGKRKRFAEAQTRLERAVRIDPDNSEAHNNLGVVYAAQGRLKEAVAQFREAARADPSNRGARENLRKTESLLPR